MTVDVLWNFLGMGGRSRTAPAVAMTGAGFGLGEVSPGTSEAVSEGGRGESVELARNTRASGAGSRDPERSRVRLLAARGLAALLLVAFAALLALPLQAQAATLVSNIGQTNSTSTALQVNEMAQGFVTGDNTGGYSLESIEIDLASVPGAGHTSNLTVALWSADVLGKPDSLVATLSNPSNLSDGAGDLVKTFTAPPNTVLAANTTYFVHFSNSSGLVVNIDRTTSNSEDAGTASGWSINNDRLFRARGSTNSWSTSNRIGKIRVNGQANEAETPVTSDTDSAGPGGRRGWTAPPQLRSEAVGARLQILPENAQ